LIASGFTFTRQLAGKDEGNPCFDRDSGQDGREELALPNGVLTIYVITNLVV
jgi:hypothetical protein